jgi:hypothetical protein
VNEIATLVIGSPSALPSPALPLADFVVPDQMRTAVLYHAGNSQIDAAAYAVLEAEEYWAGEGGEGVWVRIRSPGRGDSFQPTAQAVGRVRRVLQQPRQGRKIAENRTHRRTVLSPLPGLIDFAQVIHGLRRGLESCRRSRGLRHAKA